MDIEKLKDEILIISKITDIVKNERIDTVFTEFIEALNQGKIRSAEKKDNKWCTNLWVKQGILSLFRFGRLVEITNSYNSFFEKDTLTQKVINLSDNIRITPGGSSIRNGCYIAVGTICMPPMFINIGTFIDTGTLVDSNVLVGTCAQIGKNVHISAGVQIGGVLEPVNANPVIIEDNVMLGGSSGIYEGVIIRQNAVISSGTIINSSTKIYDIVNENVLCATENSPLEIPSGAVVIQGSRSIENDFAKLNGLSIATPIIIKYRDAKTNSKTILEQNLRNIK